MLLNSVIIILREVLEASLLASLLLALTHHLQLSMRWVFPSFIIGIIGALFYGINISSISELQEYTGQELVNGFCQIVIFSSLLVLVYVINFKPQKYQFFITSLMGLCITLAIIREGSEIYIYLSGFVSDKEQFTFISIGALIGASIGISVGAIMYYAIAYNRNQFSFFLGQFLLAVIASGIISQVVPMFMQIDLLPAQAAIWDSTFILSEESIIGQLTYAIIGYESTPTLLQISINVLALLIFLALLSLPKISKPGDK